MATHEGHWTQWTWLAVVVRREWIGIRTRSTDPGRSRPPLSRGERILAGSATTNEWPVIGSTRALYHRHGAQSDDWTRIGWEEVDHVTWLPATGRLTLTGLTGGPPITLHLGGPGRLPAVIRDRVAAAVITTSVVDLQPGTARITVRRQPGTDALVWTVQLGSGLDADDPEVQQRVDTAIRQLRADLGL
jgi:hypothetical protein